MAKGKVRMWRTKTLAYGPPEDVYGLRAHLEARRKVGNCQMLTTASPADTVRLLCVFLLAAHARRVAR